MILVITVGYFLFLDLGRYDLGKFIYQRCTLVAEFVGMSPLHLNDIDLLVEHGDLLGDGIDIVDRRLDLIIDGSL